MLHRNETVTDIDFLAAIDRRDCVIGKLRSNETDAGSTQCPP